MTKRLCLSLALALVATLVIAMPVLAAYYAYIYVEEADGNSYESLPASVPCNTTILIQGDFMSSTALDTRVLTGSGEALPHMVADDKVMFITDLAAYEKKTLIFYLGATSLSSFPIIVGHNGSFETPDDPDLELGYVMELLISGYFNAETADIGHNILYKDDAFRVWISAEHTLRVAALNSTGDEQWECHYSNFTTGYHTVYLVCNGLFALLYIDAFDVAKDTSALYENVNWQLGDVTDSGSHLPMTRRTFYGEGRYWAFWLDNSFGHRGWWYYSSSTDGAAWEPAEIIYFANYSSSAAVYIYEIAICYDGTYIHLTLKSTTTFSPSGYVQYVINYYRGDPAINGTISWDAVDLVASCGGGGAGDAFYGTSINVDFDGYPWIMYGEYQSGIYTPPYYAKCAVIKSSTKDGTFTNAGGYPQNLEYYEAWPSNYLCNVQHYTYLAEFQGTSSLYALWSSSGVHGVATTYALKGNYYNGAAWSGSPDTIFDGYSTNEAIQFFDAMCDDDGNMFIIWSTSLDNVYMRIRYADSSWGSPTLVAASAKQPSISYSSVNHCVYVVFVSGNYVYGVSLVGGEVSHSGVIFTPVTTTGATMCNSGYGDYAGILYCTSGQVQHAMIGFYWAWNDNGNDWQWNQDNACPYIDDIQMAIDGELQLEYKPASIIQGTTLPDEENNHDATITWGTNPAGVDTSMSALQFEQSYNETYYYQYLSPGSTDIIKPEPEGMGGDVDLDRLHDNPLYPLVQVLTIAGFLTERLVWLGLAWLIVIAAMFLVHLGPDTHKDSEKPQHFILTTITGLGLSILFYTAGIFPLWVIILMAFGFVGAIIWERQPVL
jgi:hypothetical protein